MGYIILGFFGALIYTAYGLSRLGERKERREVLRRHRGQCSRCGYDMRGTISGGCPECGYYTGFSPSTEQALAWLESNQPWPPADKFTERFGEELWGVIRHFRNSPDERCIRPLVFSMNVGTDTEWLDVIRDLVCSYPADVVVPVLRDAIRSPSSGTQLSALYVAQDVYDRRLLEDVRAAMFSPHEHVRQVATVALQQLAQAPDRDWLTVEASSASDAVAANFRRVLDSLNGPGDAVSL